MMSSKRVVARIKGGLGNQLFCYAAARRLALKNQAELILDSQTGFSRDYQYRRKYALDHFSIPCRKASPRERLQPFERYRRGIAKLRSRKRDFSDRAYLEQEFSGFDPRLLSREIEDTVYLDGYWQSEAYFKDVEDVIREDLKISPPQDAENQSLARKIKGIEDSVALHIRWFCVPESQATHNLSTDYYQKAIALMQKKLNSPHFFLFSDDPQAATEKLNLADEKVTYVSHNQGDENAYADLWLMSQCAHFITANSTFSWWGAWLASNSEKIVITPDIRLEGLMAWGLEGQVPKEWIKMR